MNPCTEDRASQPQPLTVFLTTNWSETVEICIAALTAGTPEGQRLATAELRRMARAADGSYAQQAGQQTLAKPTAERPTGHLAARSGKRHPLEVCSSARGFYIGTREEGLPYSRESVEYWSTSEAAAMALASGAWTQRLSD